MTSGSPAGPPAARSAAARFADSPWMPVAAVGALLTLVRLVLLPAYDLIPQGAYYSIYARNLDLSYYDHPPMIGLLIAASTALFGWSEAGLRLGLLLVTLGTQGAFVVLARRIVGEAEASRATLLWIGSGMVTLLSLVATPDVPLLFFWTLSLLALHRALFDPEAGTLAWIAAGLAMGLAFDSKYTGVFLQVGLVLYVATTPGLFRLGWGGFARALRGPAVAIVTAQLAALPVYVWNVRHGFASLAFQSVGRAEAVGGPSAERLAGYLLCQAVVLLPPLAWALAAGSGRGLIGWLRAPRATDDATRFLLVFTLPLLVGMTALAPFTWVKLNWPWPAYVTGALLAARWVGRRQRAARPGRPRRTVASQLAVAALLHAVILVEVLLYPVPVPGGAPWQGWEELGTRVEALAARHPDRFVFAADGYRTTAQLRFYTDLPALGRNVLGDPGLQFDYVDPDPRELVGRDALFLMQEKRRAEAEEALLAKVRARFREVSELPPIELRFRGETVRRFRVFDARGYLGPEAPPRAPPAPPVDGRPG